MDDVSANGHSASSWGLVPACSISAVAYELVYEAVHVAKMSGFPTLGFLAGALTFFFADLLIGRMGGRQDADTNPAAHSSLVAPARSRDHSGRHSRVRRDRTGRTAGRHRQHCDAGCCVHLEPSRGRREHVGNESWRMEPREGISALGNDRIGLCFRIGRGFMRFSAMPPTSCWPWSKHSREARSS